MLEQAEPGIVWPAASTIGALLAREGLAMARKRRHRVPPYTQPFAAANQSNRVWCADFKGWFRTQDGARIDPLTITDAHSRYLLRCQAVEKTDTERVHRRFLLRPSANMACPRPFAATTEPPLLRAPSTVCRGSRCGG